MVSEAQSTPESSSQLPFKGQVLFVPTPLGNLADMTLRAIQALRQADVVACEDTRHTGILLKHHQIQAKLISFHEHNEASRSDEIIGLAQSGQLIAVVSDAGMPGISDPGERLIQKCLKHEVPFEVLSGPSAVITALVGSGLPCLPFTFHGFLPPKSGGRQRDLALALQSEHTQIFYESPHRLLRALEDLTQMEPERKIVVARELSKKFEQYHRGSARDLLVYFQEHPPKGEIVLLISGKKFPKWQSW